MVLNRTSDMTEELPEIESFTSSVAKLHRDSIPKSPGKFGFPITTYMGPLPQDNTWCDTWEEYFIRGMTRMLDLERNVQGPNEELENLTQQLYEKVIPRLLRPLDILKSIKPVLIHGDLWYGNCCTDNATGNPIVFDACVFWAHNECKNHEYLLSRQVSSTRRLKVLRRRNWHLESIEISIWKVLYQSIPETFPCLRARRRSR